jgi:dTDP-4-amino-4,6-dideoxygalactose transaminase
VVWNQYNEAFKNLPVFTPTSAEPNTRHAYHLYSLLIDIDRTKVTRDQFLNKMTAAGIGVGVHYIALNLQPFYQTAFGYKAGDCPNAEWISDRPVSIPISAKLTDEDVSRIIESVKEILA